MAVLDVHDAIAPAGRDHEVDGQSQGCSGRLLHRGDGSFVPGQPAVVVAGQADDLPPVRRREILQGIGEPGVGLQRRPRVVDRSLQQLEAVAGQDDDARSGPRLDRLGQFGSREDRRRRRLAGQVDVADHQHPPADGNMDLDQVRYENGGLGHCRRGPLRGAGRQRAEALDGPERAGVITSVEANSSDTQGHRRIRPPPSTAEAGRCPPSPPTRRSSPCRSTPQPSRGPAHGGCRAGGR